MTSASMSETALNRAGGSSSSRLMRREYERFLEEAEVDQFLQARSPAQIFDAGDLAELPVADSSSNIEEFAEFDDHDLTLLDAFSVADVDYVRESMRRPKASSTISAANAAPVDFESLAKSLGFGGELTMPTAAHASLAGETARLRQLAERAFLELADNSDALDLPLSGA